MRGTSEFSIRAHTEIVITSPKNKGENPYLVRFLML